jgi:CheY-like chemotaxis protein
MAAAPFACMFPAAPGRNGPPFTVLVVEDDDDTRVTLEELLRDHGYEVVPLNNGRAAEEYLRTNAPPACMVLDLWMPEMNGWTLAASMRRGQLPMVPTVVVTAAEPHWGYPSVARKVLRKPLDADVLLQAVQALLPANQVD